MRNHRGFLGCWNRLYRKAWLREIWRRRLDSYQSGQWWETLPGKYAPYCHALPMQMNAQADAQSRIRLAVLRHGKGRETRDMSMAYLASVMPEISAGHLHQAPTAKSSDKAPD